jgi:UDP-N-acetyl-D-mannosaminuronic acid transferase (WecB/TagA/CpsF family)
LEKLKKPTKKTLVFTPNPEMLLRAEREESFLHTLQKADYLTPDANGLYVGALIGEGSGYISALFRTLLAKKNLRNLYGELIKGSDLTRDLTLFAERTHQKILILDNYRITEPKNQFEVLKKSTQENITKLFAHQYPELDITVFFDGEKTPAEMAHAIQQENIAYVFSCIGMCHQEERLVEIFAFLPEGQKVV